MEFNIENINVLPNKIEQKILKLINKSPPTCYMRLSKEETVFLEKKIINRSRYKKYNINLDQIKSIRSSFIKNKIIKNHSKLLKNTNSIISDYNKQKSVLEISKIYDGSPLNIMRIILLKKYSKKIFNNPELLNTYDFQQFTIAKENDDFALINQDKILDRANNFEKQIENILIKNNIKYKTQEDLTQEQMKAYGKAISTPDFLIESQLKINNCDVKWIDAKNFYGANIEFVKTKIKEQTRKYINNYGSGCIIFKLGFNEKYSNNSKILFLSWKAFNKL